MTTALRPTRFWVMTLATVLMVVLTFSLGRWQLSRAAYKEQLQAAMEAQKGLPPLDAQALVSAPELALLVHRQVALSGRWLAGQTVYLDNRPQHGRPGFWVMTPLELADAGKVVLVQRGWIARDFLDRNRLAAVQTPGGQVQVTGRMALKPGQLYEFKGGDVGRIRQNLDIAAYRAETRLPLLDAVVVQTDAASQGLQRDWDAPNTGVDKHYGYAFQWFALCALLVGLYGWFQWLGPRRQQQKLQAAQAANRRTD